MGPLAPLLRVAEFHSGVLIHPATSTDSVGNTRHAQEATLAGAQEPPSTSSEWNFGTRGRMLRPVRVHFCDTSDCMTHAVHSRPCGQRKLEWRTCCFNILAELLRDGFGHQSSECGACGDPSHSSVFLLQSSQCGHCETMHRVAWHCPACEISCCEAQQLKGFRIVEANLQHFVRAAPRSWG